MKKITTIIAIILIVFSLSFKGEKFASVKLSATQWTVIYNIMEQSNAPHTDVKTAQGWLLQGIGDQLKDSTNKK